MQIRECGENSVILSISYDHTAETVAWVQRMHYFLRTEMHPSIDSIRPGLDCILLEYSNPEVKDWLKEVGDQTESTNLPETKEYPMEVPICYAFGQDIPGISAATSLQPEEIIRIHSSATYKVWMMGFMPGYPYLGELPQELQIPRKQTPDVSIPAGSVAIAEEYVGIYPFQSPGGWHVIGRTPWKIFDAHRETPCTFEYGMKIKFISISPEEFERIKQ